MKETPFDIQLEFLDYSIGEYINEYNGYYIGLFDGQVILINTITENHYRIIEKYYIYNSILNKYKLNEKSFVIRCDYKMIKINEFIRFKNNINNIIHLYDQIFVGESQIYDRFTNKFHNVTKPKHFYKTFNCNMLVIKYLIVIC